MPKPRRPSRPLVAVTHEDAGLAESLRHAVDTAVGWRAVVVPPDPHALAAAYAGGAAVALVGCGALADLPARRELPLLAVGDDTRPTDLRAALAAWAVRLLVWPDDTADLATALEEALHSATAAAAVEPPGPVPPGPIPPGPVPSGTEPSGTVPPATGVTTGTPATAPAPPGPSDHDAPRRRPSRDRRGGDRPARREPAVVVVAGVQGGVGTTTLAAHLAGAWARWGPAPVLLADLAGGLGVRLDLEPDALGWSAAAVIATGPGEALPADVLSQPWPGLSVLPLQDGDAAAGGEPPPEPRAVQAVLTAARRTFQVVVVDLAPRAGDVAEPALDAADLLLPVARADRAGLRALDRLTRAWSAAGRDPGACGAAVACGPGSPIDLRTVRAHLGDRLWAVIPGAAADLGAACEDGMLLLDRAELPAVQAMLALAQRLVPFSGSAVR